MNTLLQRLKQQHAPMVNQIEKDIADADEVLTKLQQEGIGNPATRRKVEQAKTKALALKRVLG